MATTYPVLADNCASISELKKNPTAIMEASCGEPVAILNRNRPVFYLVTAEHYEAIVSVIGEKNLSRMIRERRQNRS